MSVHHLNSPERPQARSTRSLTQLLVSAGTSSRFFSLSSSAARHFLNHADGSFRKKLASVSPGTPCTYSEPASCPTQFRKKSCVLRLSTGTGPSSTACRAVSQNNVNPPISRVRLVIRSPSSTDLTSMAATIDFANRICKASVLVLRPHRSLLNYYAAPLYPSRQQQHVRHLLLRLPRVMVARASL